MQPHWSHVCIRSEGWCNWTRQGIFENMASTWVFVGWKISYFSWVLCTYSDYIPTARWDVIFLELSFPFAGLFPNYSHIIRLRILNHKNAAGSLLQIDPNLWVRLPILWGDTFPAPVSMLVIVEILKWTWCICQSKKKSRQFWGVECKIRIQELLASEMQWLDRPLRQLCDFQGVQRYTVPFAKQFFSSISTHHFYASPLILAVRTMDLCAPSTVRMPSVTKICGDWWEGFIF